MATDSSEKRCEDTGSHMPVQRSDSSNQKSSAQTGSRRNSPSAPEQNTTIQKCIESELARYFNLLDGQAPHDLHRMVMSQVESSLLRFVLVEVGNNQSRAAEYLGISRGTLRSRIAEHHLQDQ